MYKTNVVSTTVCATGETKEDTLDTPPYDVNGIANVITCFEPSGTLLIWLMEGDRHFWPDGVKAGWGEQFFPKGGSFKGAPHQVYTVTNTLTFLGKTYDATEQARYILAHMLSKKWAPKLCFEDEAEASDAVAGLSFNVSDEKLNHLHEMLMSTTAQIAGHYYHELVMGGNDGGPTKESATIVKTLKKETDEEAGLVLKDGQAIFKCWADRYLSSRTNEYSTVAIFETVMDKKNMEDTWESADADRRPKGFAGWRCPHSWFKKIPDINVDDGDKEKARQETRNGGLAHVHDAIARDHFMDKKNRDVVNKILPKINVSPPVVKYSLEWGHRGDY